MQLSLPNTVGAPGGKGRADPRLDLQTGRLHAALEERLQREVGQEHRVRATAGLVVARCRAGSSARLLHRCSPARPAGGWQGLGLRRELAAHQFVIGQLRAVCGQEMTHLRVEQRGLSSDRQQPLQLILLRRAAQELTGQPGQVGS